MTSKLFPYDAAAVTVFRNVTPEILTCSAPFLRFGRVQIGSRSTIVRLASGDLAVFSPTHLTDETRQRVDALGRVKYITAPDVEHHVFLDDWHKAYPEAVLIGPADLAPKREKAGKKLPFAHLWKADAAPSVDADFDKEFEYEFVHAHPNKELVFNHRPTRTLITADLFFNLPATEQTSKLPKPADQGLLTRLFVGANGTQGEALGQKRVIWWLISAQDRKGYSASIKKIDAWDFDRIIPCHGDVIETGGKGIFRKVFDWQLNGKGGAKKTAAGAETKPAAVAETKPSATGETGPTQA